MFIGTFGYFEIILFVDLFEQFFTLICHSVKCSLSMVLLSLFCIILPVDFLLLRTIHIKR